MSEERGGRGRGKGGDKDKGKDGARRGGGGGFFRRRRVCKFCAEKIDYAYSLIGGVRKLLFASGAPATDPAAVLAMLFEANLTEDDRAKILYGNAQRLFGFAVHEEDDAPALAPMGG